MRISDWSSDVCSSDLQLEQPVAAAGLQVVVALGLRRGDQLDLPRVEAVALIGLPALRLEGAVVGQEDWLRTGLDTCRGDAAARDVGRRLGSEDDATVRLCQRLGRGGRSVGKGG